MAKPPRNGKGQRQRGDRFEREIVNTAKDTYGLEARRIPLSGAVEGFPGDIEIIAGFDGKTRFQGECKRRKALPEWIVNALGDNNFMAMRDDGGETLVMLRLPTFLGLLQ